MATIAYPIAWKIASPIPDPGGGRLCEERVSGLSRAQLLSVERASELK